MGKKKSSAGGLSAGTKVQVKPEIHHPEFPDVAIGGWPGTIVETMGKGADMKLVIDWSPEAIAQMPPGFAERCEEQQLLSTMACLGCSDVDVADS